MAKIILTLMISLACLGLASFLFSIEKDSNGNTHQLSTNIKPAKLPAETSFLTASLNPNFRPIRNWSIEEPEIKAKAAGIFDLDGNKFLFQKNIKEKLPIASLTKIITAIITLENLALEDIITVSKKAIMAEGENGNLIVNEKLTVRDLLYIMLMESSNDAAVVLSSATDTNFMDLTNQKIQELGLKNTYLVDPTGISQWNYSTIFELAQIVKYSLNQPLIWQILGVNETEISSQEQIAKHHLSNTNKLLVSIPDMIGGKTGFTEEAGGCMITLIKIPDNPGKYFITLIFGSENRELETKQLIEWTQKAYIW